MSQRESTIETTMSDDADSLGILADPAHLHSALDITGRDPNQLVGQLRQMVMIRKAEERIGEMVEAGKVHCPCHLGIGQEAIAVGISSALRRSDRGFGAHRSHTHYLALNDDVTGLFAEVLGKVDGCSKGMGGSMHLIDQESGFYGSVPIVGATVPIAVGAALAAKMDGEGDIAVSYFGDGAIEEGGVQESLNLASSMRLPVLFVCENNFFSSHMHIDLRQPADATLRFARAHHIRGVAIDGNDVTVCATVAEEAVESLRRGEGPYFIEAVTYRWRGHVGPAEDLDVGVKRKGDLAIWKERDPISRVVRALDSAGHLSGGEFDQICADLDDFIDSSWERAEASEFPPASALYDCIYSGTPRE